MDSSITICAACGKAGDNLKICTACKLVKYCNRDCQISHRSKHKKECRKRAAELQRAGDNNNTSNSNVNELSEGISDVSISGSVSASTSATDKKTSTSCEQNNTGNSNVDTAAKTSISHEQNCNKKNGSPNLTMTDELAEEIKQIEMAYDIGKMDISDDKLFADPPPKDECPLCMQPMPNHSNAIGDCGPSRTYNVCCGTTICDGCTEHFLDNMETGDLKDCCPFCRVSIPFVNEELAERVKNRVKEKENDAEACYMLASFYCSGRQGLPMDRNKALELWKRAAELGSTHAHWDLGVTYYYGKGVNKDHRKGMYHFKLGAMGGNEEARHQLGKIEGIVGNNDRAKRHFIIAARSGHERTMKFIQDAIKGRHLFMTKDEYLTTLRAYKCSRDEMKSAQRDRAAKLLN